MAATDEVARLVKEAAAAMKHDAKGAVAKLESAFALARDAGGDLAASVAEELARGWGRRRKTSRSLYFATKATKLAPERKAAWTTLAKTCELAALRQSDRKRARGRALYRAAAAAFEKAASMTKDPEDKRWLRELARDAARAAKPPKV